MYFTDLCLVWNTDYYHPMRDMMNVPVRAGYRTGQDRTGQDRNGQDRTGIP